MTENIIVPLKVHPEFLRVLEEDAHLKNVTLEDHVFCLIRAADDLYREQKQGHVVKILNSLDKEVRTIKKIVISSPDSPNTQASAESVKHGSQADNPPQAGRPGEKSYRHQKADSSPAAASEINLPLRMEYYKRLEEDANANHESVPVNRYLEVLLSNGCRLYKEIQKGNKVKTFYASHVKGEFLGNDLTFAPYKGQMASRYPHMTTEAAVQWTNRITEWMNGRSL